MTALTFTTDWLHYLFAWFLLLAGATVIWCIYLTRDADLPHDFEQPSGCHLVDAPYDWAEQDD